MNDNRLHVLQMLAAGEVSPEEADRIFQSLVAPGIRAVARSA